MPHAFVSSRPKDARRAKYELMHTVRVHLGCEDDAFGCMGNGEDTEGIKVRACLLWFCVMAIFIGGEGRFSRGCGCRIMMRHNAWLLCGAGSGYRKQICHAMVLMQLGLICLGLLPCAQGVFLRRNVVNVAGRALKVNLQRLGPLVLPVTEMVCSTPMTCFPRHCLPWALALLPILIDECCASICWLCNYPRMLDHLLYLGISTTGLSGHVQ